MYVNIPNGGFPTWKAPVDTAANLPSVGNQDGDARVVKDTDKIYIWTGVAWVFAGGSGTGDVVGPASAVDNNIVTFDGTTGKLIQDSGISITDIQETIAVMDSSSIDFTFNSNILSGTVIPGGIDHNSLANLTVGDPHTQYALLAGRTGGQTLFGSPTAFENLTIRPNSAGANGSIFFGTLSVYDETNVQWGIGTTSPQAQWHLAAGTGDILINGGTIGTGATDGLKLSVNLLSGVVTFAQQENANVLFMRNGVDTQRFLANETVFNEGGANLDFRVEGDAVSNLFVVDASADSIGIGTATPGAKLDIASGTARIDGLTASRVVVSGASKDLESATTTTTEVQLLSGRTHLGPIILNTNITPVTVTNTSADGMRYTIPANTLNAVGDYLDIEEGFTYTVFDTLTIIPVYNETGIGAGPTVSGTAGTSKTTITRISSSEVLVLWTFFDGDPSGGAAGQGAVSVQTITTVDFTDAIDYYSVITASAATMTQHLQRVTLWKAGL